MVDKIKDTIKKYRMINHGDKVLLAVSGGPDSVCMAHVLCKIAPEYGLNLHFVYFDHGIREGTHKEMEFVKNMAKEQGYGFTSGKADVPGYAKLESISIEEAARRLRYKFLEEVADSEGCDKIALGHTASDQVETLIFRLARGTGLRGLTLIPPKRDRYIRPLIEITREQVLEYLRRENIPYMLDHSNYSLEYTRNFIRHRIVPLLRDINPRIETSVLRLREIVEREVAERMRTVRELWVQLIEEGKHGLFLKLEPFSELHDAIKCWVIEEAIIKVKGGLGKIEKLHIEQVLEFINSGKTGNRIELPGLYVINYYNKVLIAPRLPEEVIPSPVELPVGGEATWGDYKFVTRIFSKKVELMFSPYIAYFDMSEIDPPLTIRARQPGDRMRIFGKGYLKKLQDIFVDLKVPRYVRDLVPLVCDKNYILWVVGYKRSAHATITPTTQRVLEIKVTQK